MWVKHSFLIGLSALSASSGALTLTLEPSQQAGVAGGSLIFRGTVANDSATPIFVTVDDYVFDHPGLNLDDILFFNTFPRQLAADESITADLFAVESNEDADPADYAGRFILYGGETELSFDELASSDFQATITAVPEPGSITAFCLGASLLAQRRRQKRP